MALDTWCYTRCRREHKGESDPHAAATFSFFHCPFTSEKPTLDMPVPVDNEQDEYSRALHFITENEPEQRLRVQVSHESYLALQERTRELYGDAEYPRLDYFPSYSTLIIKTKPSPLALAMGQFLQQSIIGTARDHLIQHNRPDLAARIVPAGEFSVGKLHEEEQPEGSAPTGGTEREHATDNPMDDR
ncbi:hypothetical protein V1525DRAFT_187725 [Lipomyces kononenkoae]|uniref:Uncharacterized protein n=1 Tax=Lipomyces kononenkoae TaxID=34357 RepID=A0ACC3SZ66_LIPKO